MTKRDDDQSQSDMEVGMTTAERRRRRRRGGSLRVPSDNVPRRASTAPPVVAPVPEDPALAMSIAYSFSSDASEPIPRVDLPTSAVAKATPPPTPRASTQTPTVESAPISKPVPLIDGVSAEDIHSRRTVVAPLLMMESLAGDESRRFEPPIAPEAMSTVIDPPTPSAIEPQEFEMKTREMSAVDLEALGLSELAGKLNFSSSSSSGSMEISIIRDATPPDEPTIPKMVEVRFKKPSEHAPLVRPASNPLEVELEVDGVLGGTTLETEAEEPPEADLIANTQLPALQEEPEPYVRPRRERIKTVALSDDDLEEVREVMQSMARAGESLAEPAEAKAPDEPKRAAEREEVLSVPDIDIQMLSERADSDNSPDSQDIEVDVDEEPAPGAASPVEPRTVTAIPVESRTSNHSGMTPLSPPPTPAGEPRTRAPSHPPPIAAAAQVPPAHHAPPPPPPVAHKAPPAPPPAKKPAPTPLPPKDTKPRGKPWFIDLFDEDYLRTLPFLTPQATQAEAEFVIDAMGLQPGAQVLDIGCGYGRHAMELAARGFHMVGLDISTPLLVRGGEESHRRGLTINFVRGDMRELDFEAQFDGAYCLFSTFGYFDDETNKKTIANIARALKPGGRVMIEILNRDYVIADLPTRIWWEGEGCVVLEEVELNYFSSRIQVNRSVVFDDGRQLEQEISVRAYSLHEVGKLMHAAGFRVLEVSGGYQTRGRFFGNQSRHIIVLAERKDTPAT